MVAKHDIAKKQHRERAQPQERRKWGLLEKKKDYQLRSRDFHKKEAHLKLLRKKVTDRNPDEFYHAMVNKKTDKRGILMTDRGNEELSNEQALLLKTQDSGYLKTLSSLESKKIEKLESELLFDASGKHTVFVDSAKEAMSFDAGKFFDTDDSLLFKRENRLRNAQLQDANLEHLDRDSMRVETRKRLSKFKELDRRLERKEQLDTVNREKDLQRELMKKGDKKKIVGKDGKTSWKWKNVRKR